MLTNENDVMPFFLSEGCPIGPLVKKIDLFHFPFLRLPPSHVSASSSFTSSSSFSLHLPPFQRFVLLPPLLHVPNRRVQSLPHLGARRKGIGRSVVSLWFPSSSICRKISRGGRRREERGVARMRCRPSCFRLFPSLHSLNTQRGELDRRGSQGERKPSTG